MARNRHGNNRRAGYRHDPARRDLRAANRELVVAASGNGHSHTADTSIILKDSGSPIVVPMTNKRNPGSSPFVSAAGFAALDNGDKPFPVMPANTPGKPPMEAVGAAGNQIFAGIIAQDAEYNPDFYWRDAIDVYEKMRRNDAQINAVLQMLYLPIERTTWRIKPASQQPMDKEIASFVESCLFHDMLYTSTENRVIRQQWQSILQHILLMLPFGFSVFAKWFRVDDDGWVKWARFEPLLQRTLWRWWVGADSQLVGIQQRTFKNWRVEFEDISADRILRFAWRQEGNNYDGWSVLRSAYKHWYYLDGMYKIQAIAVERSATMPPIGTLGPSDISQAAANAMLAQLQNMRVSDSMGIVLPFGQQIKIPQNHMRGSQEIDSAIAHHDMKIARNVLAQFINLGSTETGAYALADVQSKTFMESEEAVAQYITSVLNTDAIPELVDYNYDGVSIYPLIEYEPLADSDVKDIAMAIQQMASFISPDPDFEDYVRKLVGAPSAPKGQVVATNPTAPDKNATKPGSNAQETKPGQPGIPENPADEAGDGKTQAGNATAAGLVEQREVVDTRLLNEALAAIYGRDATERGLQHLEHMTEIADADETVLLYNPNHDGKGRFTSGGGAVTTVAKGQGRTMRGPGGKRVSNTQAQTGAAKSGGSGKAMTNEQVGKAVEQAIHEYGTSAGFAHATDIQSSFKAHYGMSKDQTNAHLNALRVAGEQGKSAYTLHYEQDEENWRSLSGNPRMAPLHFRGQNFDFVELLRNGVPVTNEAKGLTNKRFTT